jgi:anti-anti-sigma regulatory factor
MTGMRDLRARGLEALSEQVLSGDALGLDARFLCDATLLAALHGEVARRGDLAATRRALLQIGFLHGLRDALRVRRGGAGGVDEAALAAAPLVPMRFRTAAGGGLLGAWPARVEAEAALVAHGRSGPGCLVSAGYTSGWMSGLWDADVVAVECGCAAHGDPACTFEVREAGAWEARSDARARAVVAALPFGALRATVRRDDPEPECDPGGFDPSSPAVHVWGPVMVVPYAGDETAVAVEAVAREPSAAGVSVVVVDLQGAIVDDGFGAVALERVVEAIEAHGAEAVLAGVSPLSERVVAGLEHGPLVIRKDLSAAIATAFQIAESQRQPT